MSDRPGLTIPLRATELESFLDHVSRAPRSRAGQRRTRSCTRLPRRPCGHGRAEHGLPHPGGGASAHGQAVRAGRRRVRGRVPAVLREFGKNLALGRGVFINMGCRFQDTGGITIGDGTLIGHGSTLTTLNHAMDPSRRADMQPAPIMIGSDVWLGASVTVLPGVTIGDGAVVGAGAVVTRDVAAHTIVGGVPVRAIRATGFGS